ncbi:hypothetical protein EYC80_004298 [Monilinia laxa]|uniref:Uncharacterized protein n=1 Tax=Monilinia laxa TaxID=61186 RepID=A0A5N6KPE8_MONLA|nr:hypothetical protein EYC80_004298 [Monilinia laxa]
MEATLFEEKEENWEIYKDAFAPQPTGKILKAWERAPVTSRAPRLHGQKIWKKRGGLRAARDNKENYDDAFMELEKEGEGARKKARVVGNKEDISRAKWHEGKDKMDAWDDDLSVGMGSPRKNVVGSPDKSQVVPRKRTNANLVITPRKPLRQILLSGEGQGINMGMPLSPAKVKEASISPVRSRKETRKSIRKLAMPVDDTQMVDEKKYHIRHTSLEFDFEMAAGQKKMEPKQGFEQSPKKTPKRQSLRRSMRGRVSEPIEVPEQLSLKAHNEQSLHAGLSSAPPKFAVDDQAGVMELDHKQDVSFEMVKSQGVESTSGVKSIPEEDKSVTTPVKPLDAMAESAQKQAEGVSTQRPAKSPKKRRASSRRSTRQSDRMHTESTGEKPLDKDGAETMAPNGSTANIRDRTPQVTSRNTGDDSNFTVTPTANLELQKEVSDVETEEVGPHQGESNSVEVPTPVQEVYQIVEELLGQSVSANEDLESVEPNDSIVHPSTESSSVDLPANMHTQQAFCDFEDIQLVKESPTAHVAPLDDCGDEDMDKSTSELPETSLEPSINVANLGLLSSTESFDDNTNEPHNAAELDHIEDPGSFDLSPINSLQAKVQPTNLEPDITSAEPSAASATSSAVDDTFSLNVASSFENDDTDMLRQFLTRVKADKAAKAAAPAPKKRRSLPHSPLRIALGDIMNAEASSPVQAARDDFDVSAPVTPSPARKSRAVTPPSADEVEKEPKSMRRSGRTRPPAKIPLPAPSSIPVRRLGGQDGDNTVTLKQSVEKEMAALTRANTRKNKSGAVLPEVLLARKANLKENPAKRQKELKEMYDEKVRREKKGEGKKKKTVVWAEEIAQYQTLEKKEKKTMESRRVNRHGERVVTDSKLDEKEKVGEGGEKKGRVKISSGSSRTSKIAVGIPTANGTLAKKKRVVK